MKNFSELKSLVLKIATEEGLNETGISGFGIYRMSNPYPRKSAICSSAICFVIQGEKSIYIGNKEFHYNDSSYLVSPSKIPVESELKNVSPKSPFLGVIVDIDSRIVSELIVRMEKHCKSWGEKNNSDLISSVKFDIQVGSCLMRLLQAVGNSMEIEILGESLLRELLYYILKSEKGYLLRNCLINHAKGNRIVPVIRYLEKHFNQFITIEDLVEYSSMSKSLLHREFKKSTSLSPMQFLKQIRLHHAHALIIEGKGSGEAAFKSGYQNQAQFSREFKRHFGYSPRSVK